MLPLLPSGSVTLAPGAGASVNSALPSTNGGTRVRLSNTAANLAYAKFGTDNTVTADATGIPVPANQTIELARSLKGMEWIAIYSAAGATVGICTGTTSG